MEVICNSNLLNWLNKAYAFIQKDFRIAVSYKLQFIFQFAQVFFGVTMIYFLGKLLDTAGESSLLNDLGGNYFSFALVGISINSYTRAGLVTITNEIRQVMNQGTLEAMCATPVSFINIILFSSLFQFLFESFRVFCYFLIAIFIFKMKMNNANWSLAILTLALTAPIFLMLGMTSCSILILVKRGDPVNWLFSNLAAILAGTMFPIAVLPIWLQKISYCLPLTHSLIAARKAFLGDAKFAEIYPNLLALIIFLIILMPVTFLINKLCMKHAKKKGALSTH